MIAGEMIVEQMIVEQMTYRAPPMFPNLRVFNTKY